MLKVRASRTLGTVMLLTAVGAIGWASLALAGGQKQAAPKERSKDDPSAKVLRNIDLAHQLIDFGIANKAPGALLLASEILHENPIQDDPKLVAKTDGVQKPKGKEELTAKGVLAKAKELARDSEEYAALIKATEDKLKEKSRSPVGGYVSRRGHLHGGGRVSYTIHCHGHTHATVHPYNHHGYVDLDIYVYDQYNNLICYDRSTASSARVYFDGHGDFRIEVHMYAGDHCDYHLCVN